MEHIFTRILALGIALALLLVVVRIGGCTLVTADRITGLHIIVAEQTHDTVDQLDISMSDFATACAEHKAIGRELYNADMCEYNRQWSTQLCDEWRTEMHQADEQYLEDMNDAVAQRKKLSTELDYNWLQSLFVGTRAYTHSTWLCASPYASMDYVVATGFTRTY